MFSHSLSFFIFLHTHTWVSRAIREMRGNKKWEIATRGSRRRREKKIMMGSQLLNCRWLSSSSSSFYIQASLRTKRRTKTWKQSKALMPFRSAGSDTFFCFAGKNHFLFRWNRAEEEDDDGMMIDPLARNKLPLMVCAQVSWISPFLEKKSQIPEQNQARKCRVVFTLPTRFQFQYWFLHQSVWKWKRCH